MLHPAKMERWPALQTRGGTPFADLIIMPARGALFAAIFVTSVAAQNRKETPYEIVESETLPHRRPCHGPPSYCLWQHRSYHDQQREDSSSDHGRWHEQADLFAERVDPTAWVF